MFTTASRRPWPSRRRRRRRGSRRCPCRRPRGEDGADLLELGPLAHRGGQHDDFRVPLHGGVEGGLTASVYALAGGLLSGMIPSSDLLEGAGAWYLTGRASAGANPRPLSVRTCSRTGPVHRLDLLQVVPQRPQVVAVDRAEVGEAQLLEEHPAVQRRLDGVLELLEHAVGRRRRPGGWPAGACAPTCSSRGTPAPCGPCPGSSPARRRAGRSTSCCRCRMTRNFFCRARGVVQRLEDDARGERAVADDGHGVPLGTAPSGRRRPSGPTPSRGNSRHGRS
jgi:hypothetical protein